MTGHGDVDAAAPLTAPPGALTGGLAGSEGAEDAEGEGGAVDGEAEDGDDEEGDDEEHGHAFPHQRRGHVADDFAHFLGVELRGRGAWFSCQVQADFLRGCSRCRGGR